jgi:hypothetical protein
MTSPTRSVLDTLCGLLKGTDPQTSRRMLSDILSEGFIFDDGIQERVGEAAVERVQAFQNADHLELCIGDDRAAMMFEALDESTGMGARQLWFVTLAAGRIDRIVGAALERESVPERIDYGRCPNPADHQYLVTHHGFRPAQADERRSVAAAHEALRSVLEAEPEYGTRRVLLNAELIFLPVGWIGCQGALFVRQSGTIELIAGPIPVGVFVWAWYRGFPRGRTANDRRIDLVVTDVRDVGQALRVLGALRASVPAEALRSGITALPLVFSNVDVYFDLPSLWQAEAHGWFSCHPRAVSAGARNA